jgi:uncharacterized protein
MHMIFLNLLVVDLDRARGFYEALGFRLDRHSSDERSAALIVDDRIVIRLLRPDAFAELVPGDLGAHSDATSAVNCLSVDTRDQVDGLVARAEASGAATWSSDQEEPPTHTKGFKDPDGHVWCVTYMESVHVID